jgi:hypothetical protein
VTPAERLAQSRRIREDPTAALLAQVRDALAALLHGLAALTIPEAPVAAPIVNVDLSPLLMAVDALSRRVESLPAPVVNVAQPDIVLPPQTTVTAGPAVVVPDTVHIHPDDLDALRDVLGEVTISEQTLRALVQAVGGNRTLIGGGGPRDAATNAKLDEVIAAMGGSSAVAAYALRFDDTGTYTYVGEAAPGTAEATEAWRVKRLTNADNTIVWADGDADFDNAWTGHAGLTYA